MHNSYAKEMEVSPFERIFPIEVHGEFTLAGSGSGCAINIEGLTELITRCIQLSPTGTVYLKRIEF